MRYLCSISTFELDAISPDRFLHLGIISTLLFKMDIFVHVLPFALFIFEMIEPL